MLPPRTRRSPVSPERCNLTRAIDIVGDKWNLMILRSALYGVRRFDDFHAELNAPRTVLSGRLRKLVKAGLMKTQDYREEGSRARKEYILTDQGNALRPILIALTQWGDNWLGEGEVPIGFTQKNGGQIKAGFVGTDGREVSIDDLRIVLRK